MPLGAGLKMEEARRRIRQFWEEIEKEYGVTQPEGRSLTPEEKREVIGLIDEMEQMYGGGEDK